MRWRWRDRDEEGGGKDETDVQRAQHTQRPTSAALRAPVHNNYAFGFSIHVSLLPSSLTMSADQNTNGRVTPGSRAVRQALGV